MRKFDEQMMFSAAVRERLDQECAMTSDLGTHAQHWYAVMVLPSGHVEVWRNYDAGNKIQGLFDRDPPWHQREWAEGIAKLLNRECHHDGAWIIAFTHPPGFAEMVGIEPKFEWRRIVKLWMDSDGDVAFTVDNLDPFHMVFTNRPHYYVAQSEEAWEKWKLLMRDALQPQEHQLRPLAQLKQRGLA